MTSRWASPWTDRACGRARAIPSCSTNDGSVSGRRQQARELGAPLNDGPELVRVEEEVDGFLSGPHFDKSRQAGLVSDKGCRCGWSEVRHAAVARMGENVVLWAPFSKNGDSGLLEDLVSSRGDCPFR